MPLPRTYANVGGKYAPAGCLTVMQQWHTCRRQRGAVLATYVACRAFAHDPHTRHDHGYGAKCAGLGAFVRVCGSVYVQKCFSVVMRLARFDRATCCVRCMLRVATGSVLLLLVACVSEVSFVGGVTANKVRPNSQYVTFDVADNRVTGSHDQHCALHVPIILERAQTLQLTADTSVKGADGS